MTLRQVQVGDRPVAFFDAGQGAPLIYLHGVADVHAAPADLQPFHMRLAGAARLIAPAHPGCAGSGELVDGHAIDDVLFHYLETFDALGLDRFDLVGHCVGGWFAAEFATRHPERVRSLTLIGACGLFVPGEPIGDLFMHAQPERGVDYKTLRHLLFRDENAVAAQTWFPDGRAEIEVEVRRYQMLRFGSFVGFRPPYFYNRSLARRLRRANAPSLVLWGEEDHMVPLAHARTYAERLPNCAELRIIPGAGHATPVEAPDETAGPILNFLAGLSK
jgi:pimeloyl-ACP methyl ester carboxylesterase